MMPKLQNFRFCYKTAKIFTLLTSQNLFGLGTLFLLPALSDSHYIKERKKQIAFPIMVKASENNVEHLRSRDASCGNLLKPS